MCRPTGSFPGLLPVPPLDRVLLWLPTIVLIVGFTAVYLYARRVAFPGGTKRRLMTGLFAVAIGFGTLGTVLIFTLAMPWETAVQAWYLENTILSTKMGCSLQLLEQTHQLSQAVYYGTLWTGFVSLGVTATAAGLINQEIRRQRSITR